MYLNLLNELNLGIGPKLDDYELHLLENIMVDPFDRESLLKLAEYHKERGNDQLAVDYCLKIL